MWNSTQEPNPSHCQCTRQAPLQVSFGIFDLEADAARQYDRALILEKGRSAKTNFPLRDYQREVAEYEAYVLVRSEDCRAVSVTVCSSTVAADVPRLP